MTAPPARLLLVAGVVSCEVHGAGPGNRIRASGLSEVWHSTSSSFPSSCGCVPQVSPLPSPDCTPRYLEVRGGMPPYDGGWHGERWGSRSLKVMMQRTEQRWTAGKTMRCNSLSLLLGSMLQWSAHSHHTCNTLQSPSDNKVRQRSASHHTAVVHWRQKHAHTTALQAPHINSLTCHTFVNNSCSVN